MALIFAAPERINATEKIGGWANLLREYPMESLVANAHVKMRGTAMRAVPGNTTYVTSLGVHYCAYPRDELSRLPGPTRHVGLASFRMMRRLLPSKALNELWLPENLPLSTPLYPNSYVPCPLHLGEARRGMLHPAPTGNLSLASRVVWLRRPGTRWTRDNRRDQKLEATSVGEWSPLDPSNIPEAVRLYEQLYLEKYSRLNPAYTPLLLQRLHEREILDFQGLYIGRKLAGVIGYYVIDGWLTTPIFGYDRSLPQADGLYRRLCHRLLLITEEAGFVQHQSAGAGAFKSHRGATPHLEWIWVNPSKDRLRFDLLQRISRRCLNYALRHRL